jgi:Flp pilus assembly protein CpaB
MATIGRTLFRFAGAVLLGGVATTIDQPSLFRTVPKSSSVSVIASGLDRLTPTAPEQGTPIEITPGKRAFPVRVTSVDATAGVAQPNSRVDVLVVVGRSGDQKLVKLFMQNMRLLGIRSVPERTSDGRQINALFATIEVTWEESERLAIAQKSAELQLLVRGTFDPVPARDRSARARDSLSRRP